MLMFFSSNVYYFVELKDSNKYSHRGDILGKVVQQSEFSKTVIAKRAGYNRTSLYNHIKSPDLPFEIIEKYGKALGYDFTKVFPEMTKYIAFEDPKTEYPGSLTFEQILAQRDQWRDKYYNLLEKYNQLMEEKLNLNR